MAWYVISPAFMVMSARSLTRPSLKSSRAAGATALRPLSSVPSGEAKARATVTASARRVSPSVGSMASMAAINWALSEV